MVALTAGPQTSAVLDMAPQAFTRLHYVAGQDCPAGISEIACRTSLPNATTQRLLVSFSHPGFTGPDLRPANQDQDVLMSFTFAERTARKRVS